MARRWSGRSTTLVTRIRTELFSKLGEEVTSDDEWDVGLDTLWLLEVIEHRYESGLRKRKLRRQNSIRELWLIRQKTICWYRWNTKVMNGSTTWELTRSVTLNPLVPPCHLE